MTRKLYVGNLSFKADEVSVKAFFEAEGYTVVRASVVMNPETGRSKGFAFVEFSDPEQAQGALDRLNGKDLLGRTLRLDLARERERPGRFDRPDRPDRPRRGPDGSGPPDRDRRDSFRSGPRSFGDGGPGGSSRGPYSDRRRDGEGASTPAPKADSLEARIAAFKPDAVDGGGGKGRRRAKRKGSAEPARMDLDVDDASARRKESRRSRRDRSRGRGEDWD